MIYFIETSLALYILLLGLTSMLLPLLHQLLIVIMFSSVEFINQVLDTIKV